MSIFDALRWLKGERLRVALGVAMGAGLIGLVTGAMIMGC